MTPKKRVYAVGDGSRRKRAVGDTVLICETVAKELAASSAYGRARGEEERGNMWTVTTPSSQREKREGESFSRRREQPGGESETERER